MEVDLFLELLQVSVGTRDVLSRAPSALEWDNILSEAQRQAIAGVMACGVDRLVEEQQPSKSVRVQWAGQVLQIEQRNSVVTKVCGNLCRQLDADGFECCVLKGQANHVYYPVGMGERRNCGDIDIWAVPKTQVGKKKSDVRKTVEYVQKKLGMTGLCWLHANCDVCGVPVEVHFRPSFFSRPVYNRRFLRFFSSIENCTERKMVDGIELPGMRVGEDVIYQMNHIYRHLIDEGIGLRQIVDYFFLLKGLKEKSEKIKAWEDVREITKQEMERLGMKRFSRALMYVLREVLGMPSEYLLCEPSVKDGQFLMNEIMMSGNFGHNDPRMAAISAEKGYLHGRVSQAWRRFKRNMRFVSSYPGEVFWEPLIRVRHFVWKKLKLWKWE